MSRLHCVRATLYQWSSDGAGLCRHESLLALSNRGVFPILDASFKRARLFCCLDDRGALCA